MLTPLRLLCQHSVPRDMLFANLDDVHVKKTLPARVGVVYVFGGRVVWNSAGIRPLATSLSKSWKPRQTVLNRGEDPICPLNRNQGVGHTSEARRSLRAHCMDPPVVL